MIIHSSKIVIFKYQILLINQSSLEIWVISGLRQEVYKMNLGHLMPENLKAVSVGVLLKEHISQRKGNSAIKVEIIWPL